MSLRLPASPQHLQSRRSDARARRFHVALSQQSADRSHGMDCAQSLELLAIRNNLSQAQGEAAHEQTAPGIALA